MADRSQHGITLDARKNHANPWMTLAVLETVESLCKHQVAGDIECGEVEPGSDIHILALVSQVSQPRDEYIDKVHDPRLLLSKRSIRESMGHETSMSAVGFVIQKASDSIPGRHHWGPVNLGIFGELGHTLSKAVDIFESLSSVE